MLKEQLYNIKDVKSPKILKCINVRRGCLAYWSRITMFSKLTVSGILMFKLFVYLSASGKPGDSPV